VTNTLTLDSLPYPIEPALILIVEDDPNALRSRELLLREEGLRVFGTDSPKEAMAFVRNNRDLDLLLADINLEGAGSSDVSGADLAADVYEFDPAIPIVIFSGTEGNLLTARHKNAMKRFVNKAMDTAGLDAELEVVSTQARFHRSGVQIRVEKCLNQLREGTRLSLQDIVLLKDATPGAGGDRERERQLLENKFELQVQDFMDLPPLVFWGKADVFESGERFIVEPLGHSYLRVTGASRNQAVDRLHRVIEAFRAAGLPSSDELSADSARLHQFLQSYFQEARP
jgi:CheY-like chemotaxis protein